MATIKEPKIKYIVHPATELCGVLCVLSNSPQNKIRCNKKHRDDILVFFNNFKNHAAVKTFADFEKNNCFNYDKPVAFFLEIFDNGVFDKDFHNCLNSVSFKMLEKFKNQILDFAQKSNFSLFHEKHKKEYSAALKNFLLKTQKLDSLGFLTKLAKWKPNQTFVINLMFGVTSANYAWRTTKGIYCNIRPYKNSNIKNAPDFAFDLLYVSTLILHEFAHLLINPLTHSQLETIKKIPEKNFAAVFKMNPYGAHKETAINESIIRAIECLFVKKYFHEKYLKFKKSYFEAGFIKLDEMEIVFEENYNQPIEKYFEKLVNVFK